MQASAAALVGLGDLAIGQAGECDYSGSEAIKALRQHARSFLINPEGSSSWRIEGMDCNPGVFLFNVAAYVNATWYLLLLVLYEVCATVFSVFNIKISNVWVGLSRCAILLSFFIVIHAVGNLRVFKGPGDFIGYGYFYVRLYWTGFGLSAIVVEEYFLLSVLLHVFVGLKHTWGMKLALVKSAAPGWRPGL
jgi:hypothetical protein